MWTNGTYQADGAGTSWFKIKNPRYIKAEGRRELFEERREGAPRRLHAAARLLRLAATKIRIDEAYALLSDIYASFSEGLNTPDLFDARTLLASVRADPTFK